MENKIKTTPWNKGLIGDEYKKHYKKGFGGIFKKGNVSVQHGKTYEEAFGEAKAKEIKDKMRQRKLANPTRYWFGKERPEISGKNSVLWKDVKAPRTPGHTHRFKHKIRYDVLDRDKYESLVSGSNEDLVVHHIDFNKYNNDTSNLITVTRAENSMFNYRKEFYTWQLKVLLNLEYGYEYPNLFPQLNTTNTGAV
jgi:hypothetical protein